MLVTIFPVISMNAMTLNNNKGYTGHPSIVIVLKISSSIYTILSVGRLEEPFATETLPTFEVLFCFENIVCVYLF